MGNTRRRIAVFVVVPALGLTACRGEADKRALPTSTVATSTTLRTEVAGLALDAPTTSTARAVTPTANPSPTTQPATRRGADVRDAPREPTTQRSDNAGSVEYDATPTATSSRQNVDSADPFEFLAVCQVAADGHGTCTVDLTNHVTRNAVFPDGLKITLSMQRQGGGAVEFVFDATNIRSLRPGEQAHVDATIDLTEQGRYDYFATTTVGWP